jgi:hypothetical protein
LKTNLLVELDRLIHLPWESIDQKQTFPIFPARLSALRLHRVVHSVFEQLDRYFGRNDLAFTDVGADYFAVLGSFALLFGTE